MVFVSLLKREWLEHGSAFIWSPLVIVVLIVIAGLRFTPAMDINVDIDAAGVNHSESIVIEGEDGDGMSVFGLISNMALDVAGSTDAELSDKLGIVMRFIAMPFFWVLLIMSLFALVSALYEERKDRSILFFKSMPVSDWQTVLSKYTFVAWVAPVITIGMVLIAQMFVLTLLSLHAESGFGGRIWSNSGLLTGALQMVLGLALNGLVLLPVFSWFLLVSSRVSSVPFVLAAAVPFWLIVLEGILSDNAIVRSFIGYHMSLPTVPRALVEGDLSNPQVTLTSFGDLLSVLAQGQFWVGVVIGLGFLAAAIYFRGVRNEA